MLISGVGELDWAGEGRGREDRSAEWGLLEGGKRGGREVGMGWCREDRSAE